MRIAKTTILLLLLLLCAIPPAQAVAYEPYQMPGQVQSTYVAKGLYVSSQKKQPRAVGAVATMPTATFSSTSSYAGTLHMNEGTSMLNADGSIALGASMSTPRRSPGTPDVTPGQDEQQAFPVGDAVWPLLLMAMLFGGILYFRRRKLIH